jgi:hypothetical protein
MISVRLVSRFVAAGFGVSQRVGMSGVKPDPQEASRAGYTRQGKSGIF